MTALEAYALAKKIAVSAVSGVKSLSVDGTKLLIETNDGNTLELDFPTPEGIKIGYYDKDNDKFYKNDDLTGEIQGKDELLYIDKNENKLYHWSNEGDPDKFQLLAGGDGENKVEYDEDDFDFDEENQILSLKSSRRFFIGTQEEWDALTVQQRQKYSLVHILDDSTSGGGSGDAKLTSSLTSKVTVGGIESGKTYNEGTSLETLWRDLLDPVMYPALTAPSATLSAAGTKLLEKGESKSITLTVTFNRGSINPAYGTSGYRSGAATGYTLNGGTEQAENTFSVTVDNSHTSYQASVAYGVGEQPKDSSGENYSSPFAAGSVNTNTITYEFVDALWANTANIATVAKLGLVSKSAKQKDFVFPAQTVANPEVFDVPASWTISAVQVKNDLSGAYENASDQFTVTNVTHNDAAGNSVDYKRYTFSLGYPTGARTVRIKWN